jgi:hypothetical protein
MYRYRILLCVLALSFLSVAKVFAQEPSCLHRTLPITIFDSRGHLIHGLAPLDFTARVHGQAVKVLSFSADTRPHRIVVLLDTSASMAGQSQAREWRIALAIASHIAQANLQSTSLALELFSDRVHEQIDFSQGAPAVLNRLKEISSDPTYIAKNIRGQTALYDTILSAMHLLEDSHSSDSIYVISDGGENVSRAGSAQVLRAVSARGLRVHATLVLPDASSTGARERTPEVMEGGNKLSALVTGSGGLLVGPVAHRGYLGSRMSLLSKDEEAELGIFLGRLYMGITNNDLLEIELPQTTQKRETLSLEFSPDKKKLYKDFRLAYPRELATCFAPSP